jgi:hypothetical protein
MTLLPLRAKLKKRLTWSASITIVTMMAIIAVITAAVGSRFEVSTRIANLTQKSSRPQTSDLSTTA